MGEAENVAFLSSLAVDGHVAASTQNQALSVLVFLYIDVLNAERDAREAPGTASGCPEAGRSRPASVRTHFRGG